MREVDLQVIENAKSGVFDAIKRKYVFFLFSFLSFYNERDFILRMNSLINFTLQPFIVCSL